MSARRRKSQIAKTTPKPEPEVVAATTSVQLFKRPELEWPELYINVFISEPDYEKPMGAMFGRARCYRANTVDEADLVVFCGGPDVHPALYHEEAHETFRGSAERDKRDMQLYKECLEKDVPMLGICRGAQFLHVMNGGKLIQDLDGHNGDHSMVSTPGNHKGPSGYIDRISSTHHQAVIENNSMDVLSFIYKSETRHINPNLSQTGRAKDVEAFFYPDTCCLGFQGHPEYAGYYRYTQWCLQMVEQHIVNNKDVVIAGEGGKRYRHKKSVIIGLPPPVNDDN